MAKAKDKADDGSRPVARNRRALHDYQIEDRLEAGIALVGSEVKACRQGKLALEEAFVQMHAGEAFLVNCHIAEYSAANRFNHEPTRRRKLLLHRRELDRLEVRLRQQGQTAVPLCAYFKNGRLKLELGLGKGKSFVDRREDVRRRESKREMDRALRRRR